MMRLKKQAPTTSADSFNKQGRRHFHPRHGTWTKRRLADGSPALNPSNQSINHDISLVRNLDSSAKFRCLSVCLMSIVLSKVTGDLLMPKRKRQYYLCRYQRCWQYLHNPSERSRVVCCKDYRPSNLCNKVILHCESIVIILSSPHH